MKHTFKTIFLTVLIILCLTIHAGADILPPEARDRAEAFVTLIDQGRLEAAYAGASPLLHLTRDQQEWITDVTRLRQILGPVQQRTLKAVRAVSTFPQLPDGDYLVVQYESRMERKQQAAEIILLKKQESGWIVCAYSVR